MKKEFPHPTDDSTASTKSNALNRRSFLGAATAAAGALIAPFAKSDGAERDWTGKTPVRYPDPDIIVHDKRFAKYKLGNTPIQRVHTGTLWAEGPAWNGVGKYLVWSDIPNNVQHRYMEEDGHTSVFRHPSGNSNGNTFDWEGRQISCEHGNRRVVRYEYNGKITVLAEKFEGKPFNAPNDAVVHPNGDIWFTDPGYGSMMNYEGNKGPLHLKESVYRIDGKSGKISKVTDELVKPNGLCFSPDYKKLYVADTGAPAPKPTWVWDVADEKTLRNGKVFCKMEVGYFKPEKRPALNAPDKLVGGSDGIRCDVDGNLWASAGWTGAGFDGVFIFAPDGDLIGQILLPEICSNVCFGGTKRNRLFMTASQSLYAVYVETQGAHIC
ncbi:MAG: SMP-30/gluconolactonase/LRE family protein [Verrucomicrobiia bacterium]|jgi:gluconolactonase